MLAICFVVAVTAALVAQSDLPAAKDTTVITTDSLPAQRLVVTYFHGNVRCVTCRKLEAYAKAEIDSSFASSLQDGGIEWRLINFDEGDNDHFLKSYKLFGQALILSYVKDGKEQSWKNLDKIWELVGNEAEYREYVRQEITTFLAEQKK